MRSHIGRAFKRGLFVGLVDTVVILIGVALLVSGRFPDVRGRVGAFLAAMQFLPRYQAGDLLLTGGDGEIGPLYLQQTITQANLHGISGWEGVDVKGAPSGSCDYDIFSPFDGTVRYNGLDGYNHVDANGRVWPQATMFTIANDGGKYSMTLLHGDYDKSLRVGTTVRRGQVIGRGASNGWSTGCHDHVILRVDGRLVNYLDYVSQPTVATVGISGTGPRLFQHAGNLNGGAHGTVLSHYNGVALRASFYIPSQGGINCDSDCTTMASGDKVDSWLGGREFRSGGGLFAGYGRIYAAACPQEWGHGTRFTMGGKLFECRDRGGWINCYEPGDYDPALKRSADRPYCWVDTLGEFGWSYGQIVEDWRFVR